MIENSQYVSLQNYINKSNIVITSKNRPHSRKICDIMINSSCATQEVPMRYIDPKSELPKGIVKEGNNYYNRLHSIKHDMYTKYIMNVSILPKDDMIKRYEDISAYNKLCQAENSCLGYVLLIIKTMNRFNYIVDNSCNIINSGYGKNIFEYERKNKTLKRKEKTKLGKLLYDISSYCKIDIVNSSLFNVSTMKFDPSILYKETNIENIIDIDKIRLHYLKKIQNKMLYWIPIIRTTKNPKRPLRVYEKTSNRQSYRYKRMGYKKKIVNADIFNAFNNKQFYFPLKTYVKRITRCNKDGIIDDNKTYYEDPSATIKNMIYDPSIHSINQISNVEKDSVINASLDILEMIFGKSAPLANKQGVSSNDKNIYTNNLSFFPIYESKGGKTIVSSSTNNFYERCYYGISDRNLIRFRTYDSCTNIIIPSNKFRRSIKFNKRRSKEIDRSMYKIHFDIGIAIIDKSGRQYKTSSKVNKISLNIPNNDNYILPSLKYLNSSVYKYLNVIDGISINGGDRFIRYSSLIGGTVDYFAWSELTTKDFVDGSGKHIHIPGMYDSDSYDGKHAKHKIMEMSYDKFVRISNGFAMIPTVLQMEQFVTEYNKSFKLGVIPTPKVKNNYSIYVGDSIDSSKNVLFIFSPSTGESDANSVHSEIKFWTRSLYNNDNAYVVIFDISIGKDDGKFISGEVSKIHINTLPIYKGARILPIIQYNTCVLKDVPISGESVTGINLNKSVLNLKTWQSEKLIAEIIPENAANKEVLWVSSNPSIASVDKYGNVKALSRDASVIKITVNSSAEPNISKTCIVNVSSYRESYITDNFVKMYESDTNVRWAKYNLGVDPDKLDKVEDLYGYKFAWGENMPKNEYTEDNYKPINSDNNYLTYDTPIYDIKNTSFTHTNVDTIDDPAGYMLYPNPTWKLFGNLFGFYDAYKVPSFDDFKKLKENSKLTIDIQHIGNNSIIGIKFTSTATGYENASIFMPAHIKTTITGKIQGRVELWTNLKSKYFVFEFNLKTISLTTLPEFTSYYMNANPEWCGLYVRPIVEREPATRSMQNMMNNDEINGYK